jgi:hypothetical protein
MTDTAMLVHPDTGELAAALVLQQAPAETLADAQRAAVALQEVIRKKVKPVIFNGEQYLEFEDWQTVGRFYGVTARVDAVDPITVGHVAGFRAVAVAVQADGRVSSSAIAYCTDDEPTWRGKPLFQRASMAQTRACARVLRQVLGWVVVLAGYRSTPAEELEPQRRADPPARRLVEGAGLISKDQQKRFFAIAKGLGWTTTALKDWLQTHGYTSSSQIPTAQYDRLVRALQVPEGPADGDPA